MWQRIQTLYLAVSTALMVAMAFSAKAVTVGADASVIERISYCSYFPYIILIVIAALLDLLALTTYNNEITFTVALYANEEDLLTVKKFFDNMDKYFSIIKNS